MYAFNAVFYYCELLFRFFIIIFIHTIFWHPTLNHSCVCVCVLLYFVFCFVCFVDVFLCGCIFWGDCGGGCVCVCVCVTVFCFLFCSFCGCVFVCGCFFLGGGLCDCVGGGGFSLGGCVCVNDALNIYQRLYRRQIDRRPYRALIPLRYALMP